MLQARASTVGDPELTMELILSAALNRRRERNSNSAPFRETDVERDWWKRQKNTERPLLASRQNRELQAQTSQLFVVHFVVIYSAESVARTARVRLQYVRKI